MGSHLAQRETYAIFPAGKSTSDYLIVDLFSKKLLTILGLNYSLNRSFIEDVFKSKNYTLHYSCANLMVFKKSEKEVIDTEKLHLLPIQKFNSYDIKFDYHIFEEVYVVDSTFDSEVSSGEYLNIKNVYRRKDSDNIGDYRVFTSFIHKNSGDMYQFVNYPTNVFKTLDEFRSNLFYEEKMQVRIPEYLEKGEYMIFVGMENKIRARSLYLGDFNIR
jgi:hypothetical protein